METLQTLRIERLALEDSARRFRRLYAPNAKRDRFEVKHGGTWQPVDRIQPNGITADELRRRYVKMNEK